MYTGLHLGTIPDDEIWDSTPEAHPMEWWEWHLADSAYATCIGILTRYVQPALGALFPHEIYFNTYINFYRQYVEVRGAVHCSLPTFPLHRNSLLAPSPHIVV